MKLGDTHRELDALKIDHQTVGGLNCYVMQCSHRVLMSLIIIFVLFGRCGQTKIFLENRPKNSQVSGTVATLCMKQYLSNQKYTSEVAQLKEHYPVF